MCPTKIIREPAHVNALADMLRDRKLPITVTWAKGATRSTAQNRLSQRWYTDIARQLGDQTHEDVRAECKLIFGVPILRLENEDFRASYDTVIKPLPYEQKINAIKHFDLPVTRLMTVRQMTRFMDAMCLYWAAQGVRLTDPDTLRDEQEFAQ